MDRTYIVHPEDAASNTPIIVLAMHLWGVDAPMRDAAHRFASAGMATIVPDLYADFDAPDGDGMSDHTLFMPFARMLKTEGIDHKFIAAKTHMKGFYPEAKTAIAGFCMGGVMASFRTTPQYGYDAAAIWYGLSTDVDPSRVEIPIVASYGSLDHGIPVDRIAAFENALKGPHDVKVYDGAKHAFCDDARDAHHSEACDDSWRRSITFLQRHLHRERAV